MPSITMELAQIKFGSSSNYRKSCDDSCGSGGSNRVAAQDLATQQIAY